MGTQLPPFQKGGGPPPKFSAHVYCGQTAGWFKMAFGMEVGSGPGYIVLDGDPAHLSKKGENSLIFGPFLLWPNGWMHQDSTWYGGRPQPRRLCVRWEPPPPSKRGIFGQRLLWPNGCMDEDATIGKEVGLGLRDIVLDADPAPTPLKGHGPEFSANVCCGQTAGWTKMPLGM